MLEGADDDYLALFLDRVNAFLDGASPRIYDPLPAIERLKWHLVRRRLVPELLEVLRFQKQDLASTPPVRVRGRWYGDYPFRTDARPEDPALGLPARGRADAARVDRGARRAPATRLARRAATRTSTGIGAATEEAQRVERVALLRPGPAARACG